MFLFVPAGLCTRHVSCDYSWMSADLSRREARRAQLVALGLLAGEAADPASVLQRLAAVQLDTISVLARSHELVVFARMGAVESAAIESAYWAGPPAVAFEYWYHAACVIPVEEWPTFAFRRAERRARGRRWHDLENAGSACASVLAQLGARGPLTAREMGGAKLGGAWWDWSPTKVAAEWLLDVGEVVCTTRRGFQRVYDLPERVLPAGLLGVSMDRETAVRRLALRAAVALGVSTMADIACYVGLPRKDVADALTDLDLETVAVEGWRDGAVAAPEILASPAVYNSVRAKPRMISPFDPLLWDRPRVARVFDFQQRLEAYVPKPQRIHGYFAMPVLAGDRLIGRVDPAREHGMLVARRMQLEPGIGAVSGAAAIAAALREAGSWVGARDVVVDVSEPTELVRLVSQRL